MLRNTVTKRTPVTKPALSATAEAEASGGSDPLKLDVHPNAKPASAAAPSVGRPKKHASNAERQRAYRERSRDDEAQA